MFGTATKSAVTLAFGAIIVTSLSSCSSSDAPPSAPPSASTPNAAPALNQEPVVEAPKDFAFPIYAGATKVGWEPYDSSLPIPKYHVHFHSEDAKDKIVEFYTGKVKELGYELQGDVATYGDTTIITANKGTNHVSIQVSKDDAGSGYKCAIITDKKND